MILSIIEGTIVGAVANGIVVSILGIILELTMPWPFLLLPVMGGVAGAVGGAAAGFINGTCNIIVSFTGF
jgi:predicted membrane-bound spermidine synthase